MPIDFNLQYVLLSCYVGDMILYISVKQNNAIEFPNTSFSLTSLTNIYALTDIVILEFKQYTQGSRWRQTVINRKDHREVGNGADGFYGGVRKLCNEKEISMWKCLWPTSTLE